MTRSDMPSDIPICDYEGSPWRTVFWPGREYEDRAERIALARLLPPRGKRLVEIGAGFGRLAELYEGYERVILLDYAYSMLQEARERVAGDPRFVLVAGDLYDLPLADNGVDVAVTVRVLHHVADIPRAFAEIARIVHPGGSYIADFANKRHLKAMVRYRLGKHDGDSPFSLAPYEFVKLNFDYHPRYIRENLARVCFTISDQRAVSTFRLAFLKRHVRAEFLARVDGLIQHPTAALQLSPSMFLRAESHKPGPTVMDPALWRCLRCHSTDVEERPEALICRTCGAHYPCRDGVYDFRGAQD